MSTNVLRRSRTGLLVAALAAALVGMMLVAAPAGARNTKVGPVAATSPNPLDDGGWELVAHMSDIGGMFDGNGELSPTYTYGTFNPNPIASTPDFQRAFPVVADKILFITGDGSIWGIADYGDLRALIDARAGVFSPNLAFEVGVGGVISNTEGNVLSRPGALEDPWISIDGDHWDGIANQRIVWGENDWGSPATLHTVLKNEHGGINVYVRGLAPATRNDCKKGGWAMLVDSEFTAFNNQGDCVSFLATGGSNLAAG